MKKKLFFFFFILSFFLAQHSFAHTTNQINIPFVRENEKIDIILDDVVKLGDPSKSCIVLFADPLGGMYWLTIKGIKTDTSLLNLNFLKEKAQFGYFTYKKFLVLVVNTFDQYGFFEETDHSKTFKYKYDQTKVKSKKPKFLDKYFYSADFFFPGDKFRLYEFRTPKGPAEFNVEQVSPDKKIYPFLDKYVGLADSSRSCFEINADISFSHFSMSISGLRTDTDILNMDVFWNSPQLGYFKYKGYLVIVKLRADPQQLFSKLGSSRKFKFEYNDKKAEDKEKFPLGSIFCDGHFSDEKGELRDESMFDVFPKKINQVITLTKVKEDKRIDSLLDHYKFLKNSVNDCIFIFLTDIKEGSYLSIEDLKTDSTLIKLTFTKKSDLRFFRWNGKIVFLKKTDDQYNFFPDSSVKENFKFETIDPDPFYIFERNIIWRTSVTYKEGKFQQIQIMLR